MTQGTFRGGLPRSAAPITVALAVVVGLLAGCSADEPEPAPTSTAAPTSAAPEPEPEPVEEAPEEPEAPEPRRETPEPQDAERAAEFFIELYNYMVGTGDVRQWDSRSRDCGFCANTVAAVEEQAELGHTQLDAEIIAGPVQFVEFSSVLALYLIEAPYEIRETTVVDDDGEVVHRYDEGKGFLTFELGYSPDDGWLLFQVFHRDESAL